MSRIRSVKPEFWSDGKVSRVSRDARLLFLGLLNESDDEGRQIGSPKRVAGIVFPHDDDVSATEVRGWLSELEREELVKPYRSGGVDYLLIPGFLKHQKPQHPSASRLPHPDEADPPEQPHEDLRKPHEDLTPVVVVDLGVDLGGSSSSVAPSVRPRTPPEAVFDAWKESAGKNGGTQFSPERRRLVARALKNYPLEDVIDAVRGWRHSPHHRGENDRQTVYNDLDVLLRDAKHIEMFRDYERGTAPQGAGIDTAGDSIRRMRAMEGR